MNIESKTLFLILLGVSLYSCTSMKVATREYQLKKRMNDTMENAYWVDMMEDSTCTYAATVSAFDLYWKNRQKPIDPEINEGQDIYSNLEDEGENNSEGRYRRDSSGYNGIRDLSYVWEYKCFLNWKTENKYLLKPDGKILTNDEIMKLLNTNSTDSTKK